MGSRFVFIMAGGRGERFWPHSRLRRPKHLLPIVGDEPMLAQTIARLDGLVPPERIFVITNAEQAAAVAEVCPSLPAENIIAEPVGRDTAAAVGLATILVQQRDPQGTFAMLPADHVIEDIAGFQLVMKAAFAAAEAAETLVTVGIRPDHAATGYGYIHRGEAASPAERLPVYGVQAFKEKPDRATAETYLQSGDYFWNAGMFFWRATVIAEAFHRETPELWSALDGIGEGLSLGEPLAKLLQREYPRLHKISIDYAIMEPAAAAGKVRVVPSAFDWDDVGAWPALERHLPKDSAGNVTRGQVVLQDAARNIVVAPNGHLTAVIGVDNLMVIQTPDATLICPKDKAQEIKACVKKIGENPDWQHLL